MNKLLNIDAVSELIGIKKSTIYSYVHKKQIPFIKIGGKLLFDLKQIQSFISANSFMPESLNDAPVKLKPK